MAETPQITNAELAKNISNLVNRWNTRENQLIDMLTQPEGNVTVTDGLGNNHSLPSFPQLQKTVAGLTDDLTGAVAQAQEINSSTLAFMNEAKGAAHDSADSADASKTSADVSAASALDSAGSATASRASQVAAKASEVAALASETNAKSSEIKAAASQTSAATSESKAKTSENNAKTSETNSKTSETNAKSSETGASSSASYADAAKNAAASSATNAATSESKAKTSETNAKTSETNSASSATAAANSKTAAGTSETNAKGSENTAKAYADNAGFSAAAADSSKTAAAGSKDLAAQYANAAVNIQVEPGKYSAFHWSEQARLTAAGALIYRGQWSAATGAYPLNPKLGDFYIVSVAGTVGAVKFGVGDMLVRDESAWDKIDNQQNVTSVAGRTGAVTLAIADVATLQTTLDAKTPLTQTTNTSGSYDDYVNSGFYRDNGTATNRPGTANGQLIVSGGADTSLQIYGSWNANRYWMRGGNTRNNVSGRWLPWSELWHNNNFDPVTKLDVTAFTWSALPGKPSTFAPSAHTHAISDVTGLQTKLDALDLAGKATLAAGDDLIPNPTFDSRYDRMGFTVVASTDTSVPAGCPHPYVAKLASRDHTPAIDAFPVEPGDVIECSALVAVAEGGKDSFNLYLRLSPYSNWAPGGAGGYTYASVKGQTVAAAGTSWVRVTGRWTVPTNGLSRWVLPFLQVSQNGPDYGTTWFATDWHVRKVTNIAAVDAAKVNKAGDTMMGTLEVRAAGDGAASLQASNPLDFTQNVFLGFKSNIPRLRIGGNVPNGEPTFQIQGVNDTVRLDVPATGDMKFLNRKVWDSGNFDPATKQNATGWNAVQQGTGVGQSTNAVKIGYATGGTGKTKLTIDSTDFGAIALENWVQSNFVQLNGSSNINGTISLQNQSTERQIQWVFGGRTTYLYGNPGSGDVGLYDTAGGSRWRTDAGNNFYVGANMTAGGTVQGNILQPNGSAGAYLGGNGSGMQWNGSMYLNGTGYYLNASGNGWIRMPRMFVQGNDPGGGAYDGDLWIW